MNHESESTKFTTINLNDDCDEIVIESIQYDNPPQKCLNSPGRAEPIIVEQGQIGSEDTRDEEPNDCPPSPFVRMDYLRRSFSLPDMANIKNNVLMNHEMNCDNPNHHHHHPHNDHHITFGPNEHSMAPSAPNHVQTTSGLTYMTPKMNQNWVNGVFGCFRPIIGIFSNKGFKDSKAHSWEIAYESLTEMEYLGCGAQGSVYVGMFAV